mmetsp:Transcript_88801/g.276080  ORF Transcript_88801/g.276080 Transcript_88801/m.276080 type:complete len:134 (+) Transcript_88801:813-1214(+)
MWTPQGARTPTPWAAPRRRPCASAAPRAPPSSPGAGRGVHSGAVQAAMDEITAICCRVWRAPGCTTRKISHEVAGPAYQFRTYRAVCRIEGVKNDGALLVVKATLLDLLGEVVCTTISEMLDFERMMMLQHAA